MNETPKPELPLEARLAAARQRHAGDPDPRQVAGSAFAQGTRLALELVAGILVGAALGYFADRWLDTSPWGMILGFIVGLAAGFMNLMRAVEREAAKVSDEELAALPRVDDDEEEGFF